MLNKELLPWCNIRKVVPGNSGLRDILAERLNSKYTAALLKMAPKKIQRAIKAVLKMSFEEKPDYAGLKNIF